MPEPPPGEADLRDLARRFEESERRVRDLVSQAPDGNRRELLTESVGLLVALRREDFRQPIVTAYLAAREDGSSAGTRAAGRRPEAMVDDLAMSLHLKLDRGIKTTEGNLRTAVRKVTTENLEEMAAIAVTAHIDRSGSAWTLGAWALMNTATIGRQASTRGIVDGAGHGRKLEIDVGECGYCQEFSGEAVAGVDPLPPFHPSCTCTASAA